MSYTICWGNNEIIKINASSKQTKKITLNDKSRKYIVKYKNNNEKNGEFIIEGELRNRCKGDWIIDLTDEEIEKIFLKKINYVNFNSKILQ